MSLVFKPKKNNKNHEKSYQINPLFESETSNSGGLQE